MEAGEVREKKSENVRDQEEVLVLWEKKTATSEVFLKLTNKC